MASNEGDSDFTPFSEAIKVEKLGSHAYKVNLNDAFCIGAGACVQSFITQVFYSILI
jgi:hypothetical protein